MGRPHPLLSKNTELRSPPLVTELKLHLATNATGLWKMTTKELKHNSFPFPILDVCMGRLANFNSCHFKNPQLIKDKQVLGTGAGSGLAELSALFGFASNVDFKEVAVFTSKVISSI